MSLSRPAASPLIASVRSPRNLAPVSASHAELRGLDRRAQLLQVIHNFGSGLSRKEDLELLPAATVGLAPARHTRQVGRDQSQYLVSGVVTVGVVESLEVIDVNHRDRIGLLQPQQRIVKSAARGQRRKFIVISQQVRVLDDRQPPECRPPLAEYTVEMRTVPVERNDRKKAASDHRKALSTVFRVSRNRTRRKMPAAANPNNA